MTNLPASGGNGGNGNGNGGWPKANPLRGLGYADEAMTITYVDLALDFIKKFPIDTFVSWLSFDEWLASHGLLTIPPEDTEKQDDAWIGHVVRRGDFRDRINMAALHPRMFELNSVAYYIAAIPTSKGYQVREPHNPATLTNIMRRVRSLTDTAKKRLEFHMQSSDWLTLPESSKILAENIMMDIDLFNKQSALQLESIDTKITQTLLRLGLITPDGKLTANYRQRQLEYTESGFVDGDSNDEPEQSEEETSQLPNSTFHKLCNIFGTYKEEEETYNGFKHRVLHNLKSLNDEAISKLSEDIKDWYDRASHIDNKNKERHTNYALPHLDGLDDNNPEGK